MEHLILYDDGKQQLAAKQILCDQPASVSLFAGAIVSLLALAKIGKSQGMKKGVKPFVDFRLEKNVVGCAVR